MAKHVHIHVHDGGWEEGKHPRKDNGQFGTGKGGEKTTAQLRSEARDHEAAGRHKEAAEAYRQAAKSHPDAGRKDSALGKKDIDSLNAKADRMESMANEYRGRESGPALGSKGEAALVKSGGPVSKKDEEEIAAFAAAGGNVEKKRGMTAADLKRQAAAKGLEQVKSRHGQRGGMPEGEDREGGPLERGDTAYIHPDFADGDDQRYVVVGAEEKGRVTIQPEHWPHGRIAPQEVIEGYMVGRRPHK